MAEIHSTDDHQRTADDLISFLKAIPDGRFRRVVRYPQVPVAGGGAGDPERLQARDLEAFPGAISSS